MHSIVLIEDEDDIRNIIKRNLIDAGYSVFEASNGVEGIQLIKSNLPDLIICDVIMPEMDGYRVLENINNSNELSVIPFIFITGKSAKEDMRFGMELGADDYLIKPFTRKDLLNSVENRLKKHEKIKSKSAEKLEKLKNSISLSLPHELNSPLTTIIGLSKTLMDHYEQFDPAKIKDALGMIHKSGMRLNHLTKSYLLYIKLELALKDKTLLNDFLNPDDHTYIHLVLQDLTTQQAQKNNRQQDLVCQVDEGELKISYRYFRKIIEEIFDNALKFSEPGKSIQIIGKKTGADYHLKIQDMGRGMNQEQLQSIDAYIQFNRKFEEQQGLGLGLVITKRLIELHQGQFFIESLTEEDLYNIQNESSDQQITHGTTITLILPCVE
ncbi:MAG: response regulator [Spirochaetes bacterium]|nr:response regulator [Spirochaetota bacterium]